MKINFKHFNLPVYIITILAILILYSIFVRAQGVGYSNFQGDEVNTIDFLYEMKPGVEGLWNYLISQKRGPVQYVLNILNVNLFGYHNEAQIRYPYLFFSVFALFSLYKLAKKIFDPGTALIASTLMAINGLFIAFGRITQYQAVMYCIIPFGIILFIKALNSNNNKTLLWSGLLMSFAFLTHYDTLSVTPFFIAGFVGHYIREIYKDKRELNLVVLFQQVKKNLALLRSYLAKMGIFFSAFLLPALMYYIPFYFGKAFEDTTSDYLGNRLFGGQFMPRTEITNNLLTLYIPEYHLNFIFILGIIGILYSTRNIEEFKLFKLKIKKSAAQAFFVFFALLVLGATIFSFYPIKPRTSSLLVIGASIAVSTFLIFYTKVKWDKASLITWFLGSYSFYFFVMKDPRTHVYVSMLPLFIVAAYGLSQSYRSIKSKVLANIAMGMVLLSFFFVSGVNWVIFVDKNPEYPWYDKDFMGWPIYRIDRVRHKKIEGVFGFNNYRGWEKVADLYNRGCMVGSFNSNEKDSISYFYVRQHQKQGDEWEFKLDADNLVIIEGPHSWEYFDNYNRISGNYIKIGEIYSGDYAVSKIYGLRSLYPEGTFVCQN